MLLRRNHKSVKSGLNAEVLEKEIDKDVEHVWELTLTIDSIRHIKNMGIILLEVAEQLSINKKVEHYTKRRVTHN